jgi:phage FluMu protein Com
VIANNDETPPALCRALPGWATDAIRFGIPEKEARDRRRVWTMAMKIAMSAYRRGWSQAAYSTEIVLYENGLWRQLTTRPGGRRLSRKSGYKALWSAWDAGVANANDVGIRTREEIAADAVELAYMWVDRITDGVDNLSDVERGVMGYVIAETERRGYLRVTCPCREVAEFSKTSPMTAARVLNRLAERGLLVKNSSGRRGIGNGRRAAIYGLVDPDTIGT